jgi:nitric oxide reductase NorQ protein
MSAINDILIGYYKPEQFTTTKIKVYNAEGKECHTGKFPKQLWSNLKKSALAEGKALHYSGSGWKKVDMIHYEAAVHEQAQPEPALDVPKEQAELMHLIHTSYDLKPKGMKMNELKWKYLMRSGMRGKNIMMTGPAGCGKTMAAKALVNALDRPDFYFNLGATQDPRASLIGNTHFNKETGTYFSEALFVKAIQTPNAVILLDELSRAHPDAWNILMTVLDQGQRYLRLDEASGQETINVADGVTFIATANIGNEYTSTRVMDKALMDRFTIIEMDLLSKDEEASLLKYMFPLVDMSWLENVAGIAEMTRKECNNEESRLSSPVSTRTSVEIASLLYDGFTLQEAADITIYPQYSTDGGVDSERTFVKQIVQKFCDDGTEEDLFNVDDMEGTTDDE